MSIVVPRSIPGAKETRGGAVRFGKAAQRALCSKGRNPATYFGSGLNSVLEEQSRFRIKPEMSAIEFLGFVAAVLTTLCWLPQALKTIRTKDTKSLSLVTQSAFTAGVTLWLAYGILIGNAPIIFANAVTLVLVVTILALKLRYG
jgi:MtN3 and saliva related transmembrane protein